MRLTDKQQEIIRQSVQDVYGENARVILFGSRVNDKEKGGDIDLMVELEDKSLDVFENQFRLAGKLQRRLGPQKIDIINIVKGIEPGPIQKIALEQGVRI